jgi:hypothetical protein
LREIKIFPFSPVLKKTLITPERMGICGGWLHDSGHEAEHSMTLNSRVEWRRQESKGKTHPIEPHMNKLNSDFPCPVLTCFFLILLLLGSKELQ